MFLVRATNGAYIVFLLSECPKQVTFGGEVFTWGHGANGQLGLANTCSQGSCSKKNTAACSKKKLEVSTVSEKYMQHSVQPWVPSEEKLPQDQKEPRLVYGISHETVVSVRYAPVMLHVFFKKKGMALVSMAEL